MSNLNESKIYNSIPDNSNDIDKIDFSKGTDKALEEQFTLMLTKKKQQQKNLGIIRDTNYYFCVYFTSEDQKLEFLKKIGALSLGECFIDGFELAKKLGIQITADPFANLPAPEYRKDIAKMKTSAEVDREKLAKKFAKKKNK